MSAILLPEAKAEAREATRWYEDRRPRLGERFWAALYAAIDDLSTDPTRLPLLETIDTSNREIRRARVKKFPYVVVFEVAAKEVCIIAVAHTSRRPNYWIDRL